MKRRGSGERSRAGNHRHRPSRRRDSMISGRMKMRRPLPSSCFQQDRSTCMLPFPLAFFAGAVFQAVHTKPARRALSCRHKQYLHEAFTRCHDIHQQIDSTASCVPRPNRRVVLLYCCSIELPFYRIAVPVLPTDCDIRTNHRSYPPSLSSREQVARSGSITGDC